MRIGELLIELRKLSAADLKRALAEKPHDQRLVSYLIDQRLVEFDDASRALGEQQRVACALSKHLEGRDPAMARSIPAELGRSSCALPIGKTSKGAVIVCVRDPTAAVRAALELAIAGDFMMVVAPAHRLEMLVREAYGKAPTDELDIDFGHGGDLVVATRPPLSTPPMGFPRAGTPPPLPPPPDMDALDPISVQLADLDDVRVAKDPTQSGQVPKVTSSKTLPPPMQSTPPKATLPPATRPARPTPLPPAALGTTPPPTRPKTVRPGSEPSARRMTLDQLHDGLAQATTREDATDLVLAYVASRWRCGIVLAIRDRVAVGYRGCGVENPDAVTVSLYSPSTVQRAVQTKSVSLETPTGVGQSALEHALRAKTPAAAPVIVAGQPAAVIAVGDPIDGIARREAAAIDLDMLADALGTAYQRIHAR